MLQRPVAEDVVGDLADDLASLFACQRRPVQHELLGDGARDALADVAGRLALEQLRTQRRDAGVVDAGLQLGIRVLRGTAREVSSACPPPSSSAVAEVLPVRRF